MAVPECDEGKLAKLAAFLGAVGASLGVQVILSPGPFDHSTTFGSLTLPTGGQCPPQYSAPWSTPFLDGGFRARTDGSASNLTNVSGGDLTCYGWILYDLVSTTLYYIGDLPTNPFTFLAGTSMIINPFITETGA